MAGKPSPHKIVLGYNYQLTRYIGRMSKKSGIQNSPGPPGPWQQPFRSKTFTCSPLSTPPSQGLCPPQTAHVSHLSPSARTRLRLEKLTINWPPGFRTLAASPERTTIRTEDPDEGEGSISADESQGEEMRGNGRVVMVFCRLLRTIPTIPPPYMKRMSNSNWGERAIGSSASSCIQIEGFMNQESIHQIITTTCCWVLCMDPT